MRSSACLQTLSAAVLALAVCEAACSAQESTDASRSVFSLKGDLDALETIIKRHRENKSAIRTWQGEATIRDVKLTRTLGSLAYSSKVTFFYQADPFAVQWQWRLISEDRGDNHNPKVFGGLLTEAYYATVSVSQKKQPDGSHFKSTIVQEPSKFDSTSTVVAFHPMTFFSRPDVDLAKRFVYFLNNRDQLGNPWSIEADGNIVVMETAQAGELNEYVVDMSQGANLVEFISNSNLYDAFFGTYRWSFERIDDVWLPRRMVYDQVILHEQDTPMKRFSFREIRWNDSIVNQPIPEEVFSLPAIGVEKGDVVSDNIKGETYRFEGP